ELAHRRLRQHLDVREPAEAMDEVARHGRVEARAARDQPDLRHLAREVDERLSCGVAGADQGDLLPGAELGLRRRRPVVDAPTLELREIPEGKAAVRGAARDYHGTRAHVLAVREADLEAIAVATRVALQADDLVRDRHLGSELLRLVVGARHEREAADAGWETQIVLDA